MALAGGSTISPVQDRGYLYKEGEILSPDGHCRAFDAHVGGHAHRQRVRAPCCSSGSPTRIADGDSVLAVIRGSAINNDGSREGRLPRARASAARRGVVTEALAVAGVDARRRVVRRGPRHRHADRRPDRDRRRSRRPTARPPTTTQFCAIGSLKTNIGHPGEAAGVAAPHQDRARRWSTPSSRPASTTTSPNPQTDFPSSPFFVNARLRAWTVDDGHRASPASPASAPAAPTPT